jgi:hypothetical protein
MCQRNSLYSCWRTSRRIAVTSLWLLFLTCFTIQKPVTVSWNVCVTDCETRIYIYHSETVIIVEISFTTSEKARQMRQLGRAIAQAVSRWLPTAAARVCAQSSHVVFVVDKVELRQVFSEYFGFLCQTLHQFLHHNHPGQVRWPTCQVDPVGLHPSPHYSNKNVEINLYWLYSSDRRILLIVSMIHRTVMLSSIRI